ncbi:hypothetical protein [Photobacterium indicum]|uniref:Uncharacterized protein n=1 Tax=Photobacterium indicum TaxID=81447 RepID=A0A2T3L8M4_9GAMM|nr:hypothetical protein [Photobacterium indicum]PSV47322.1 hypothetical protein C9J47_10610 [Photobacterium indicum]
MKENLEILGQFIAEQKIRWDLMNQAYNSNVSWDKDKQPLGAKGVAWLSGTGNGAKAQFHQVGKINKIKETFDITDKYYQDFMKAFFVSSFNPNKDAETPSASKLRAANLLLRQLYYSLKMTTGQSNPIYLSSEVFNHAMGMIAEAKAKDITNLKNSAIGLQSISRFLDEKKFVLTEISFVSKYGSHNTTNTKKRQKAIDVKLAEEGTLNINDADDDKDKLISIKAFLNVIALINIVEDDGEIILLNLLLMLIITGFRFDEAASLKKGCTERVPIKGDALKLAKKFKLCEYNLKINYLGMKGSKQTVHWVEPNAIPLVEAIVAAVEGVTEPYRKVLIRERKFGFADFLPPEIHKIDGEFVELDDVCDYLLKSSASGKYWSDIRDKGKKALTNIGILPVEQEKNVGVKASSKTLTYYSKDDLNKGFIKLAQDKKHLKENSQFNKVVVHQKKKYPVDYEELLFIVPYGGSNLGRGRVYKNFIIYITHPAIQRFLGTAGGMSIFKKYKLFDEDGNPTELLTHMPRHNINTFLAIAGITDHLQAMLMGRRDIRQNEAYKHLSLAQELESPLPDLLGDLDEGHQFDFFSDTNNPVIQESDSNDVVDDLDELFSDSPLDEMEMTNPVKYTKVTGQIVFDPDISLESNFKKSLHTYGDKDEQAKYLADMVSEDFLPELNDAYNELLNEGKKEEAEELLRRHAELNPLVLGTCTRNLAQWGCPFGAKCVNGEECGYHAMTGRSGELETIVKHSINAKNNLQKLELIAEKDDAFNYSLNKARNSVSILDKMKKKSQEALAKGIIVTLIDKPTPEQLGAFKKPTTLADYFAIEHQRNKKGYSLDDTVVEEDK